MDPEGQAFRPRRGGRVGGLAALAVAGCGSSSSEDVGRRRGLIGGLPEHEVRQAAEGHRCHARRAERSLLEHGAEGRQGRRRRLQRQDGLPVAAGGGGSWPGGASDGCRDRAEAGRHRGDDPRPERDAGADQEGPGRRHPGDRLHSGDGDYQKLGVRTFVGFSAAAAGAGLGDELAKLGAKNAICVNHQQGNLTLETMCSNFEKNFAAAGGKAKQLVVDAPTRPGRSPTSRRALRAGQVDRRRLRPRAGSHAAVLKAIEASGRQDQIKFCDFNLIGGIVQDIAARQDRLHRRLSARVCPVEFLAQFNRLGVTPLGHVLTGPVAGDQGQRPAGRQAGRAEPPLEGIGREDRDARSLPARHTGERDLMASTVNAPAPVAPPPASDHGPLRGGFRKALRRPELGALVGTVGVFLFFCVAAGSVFYSSEGIGNWLTPAAELGILAVPVALLMIAGEFDLSIGSMITATGMIVAIAVNKYGLPIGWRSSSPSRSRWPIGFFNGMLVVKTGLPSFIVTLAMLFLLAGLTIGFTRILTDSPSSASTAPSWTRSGRACSSTRRATSRAVFWWIVIVGVGTWVLTKTRFGNWIYSAGGNGRPRRATGRQDRPGPHQAVHGDRRGRVPRVGDAGADLRLRRLLARLPGSSRRSSPP